MPGQRGDFAYDTNTLIQVVPNLKTAQSFLLDKFFPNIVTSDSEFVSIDVDVGKRRMAPFVSPLVEGKLVEQRRIQTNTFKPAYIKDKRAPDLRKPVRRMIGERIGGDMTGEERAMANLEFEMTDQIDVLTRRLEWMASQALQTGTVTVVGEGFPTTLIDFGRDPSLTVALSGNEVWNSANITAKTASPSSNIDGWQRQILKMSGAKVTDIVFTTSAWATTTTSRSRWCPMAPSSCLARRSLAPARSARSWTRSSTMKRCRSPRRPGWRMTRPSASS
jgi:hypothetical protein